MLNEKATSKSQQRLFGMVTAYKNGDLELNELPKSLADKIKSIADGERRKTGDKRKFTKGISDSDAKDFASTKHKGLPEKVEERRVMTFAEFIKESKNEIDFEKYDEDKYPSYRDYLGKLITSVLGKGNSYSGSADWGGIPTWTIKGDKFVGTFVIIDDNDDVVLMTREYDTDGETYIDNDIMNGNSEKDVMNLLKKAVELKSEKITEAISTKDKNIQKLVDEINELIKKAIDEDGDPIGVIDTTNTWESPMVYQPIIYNNRGQLIITNTYPSEPGRKEDSELIRKGDVDTDGLDTLKYIKRLYNKALKNK